MKLGILWISLAVLYCCCFFEVLSQAFQGRNGGGGRRGEIKLGKGRFRWQLRPSPGGRRYSRLFHDLQRRLRQRLSKNGYLRHGLASTHAVLADWNRTVDGVQVSERSVIRNGGSAEVPVVTVMSVDRRLTEVNFTRAATLYIFGDNATMRIIRPGANFPRRRFRVCFLLPNSNITFNGTMETLSARNNTGIGAPSEVERANATGPPLTVMERFRLYNRHPAVFLFCGLAPLLPASPAEDATFPTSLETDGERVLRMVTLDRELQVLVPNRLTGSSRPRPRIGPARWQRPSRGFAP